MQLMVALLCRLFQGKLNEEDEIDLQQY